MRLSYFLLILAASANLTFADLVSTFESMQISVYLLIYIAFVLILVSGFVYFKFKKIKTTIALLVFSSILILIPTIGCYVPQIFCSSIGPPGGVPCSDCEKVKYTNFFNQMLGFSFLSSVIGTALISVHEASSKKKNQLQLVSILLILASLMVLVYSIYLLNTRGYPQCPICPCNC